MISCFKASSTQQDWIVAAFIPSVLWNKLLTRRVFDSVTRRKWLELLFGMFVLVGLVSLVHPFGAVKAVSSATPLFADATMETPVRDIVTKACRNCHSEQTEWPVYSYVAPVSWMIEKDVSDARSQMNLSHWQEYDTEKRRELLSAIASMVRNHRMPPQRYLLLHPEARLSHAEAELLYQWARSERKRLRSDAD